MKYNHLDMLPERAFLRVGGQIKPQGGGGGAPTSTTVQNTSIPEYAQPYVESTLGKAADLTKTSYQPYKGDQTAGFTPMQNQAFENVGNQQIAPQLTDASNMAYQAGQSGLGAQDTAAKLQNASLGYGAMGNQAAQQNAGIANLYGGMGNQVAQQSAGMAANYAGQGAQGAFANANLSNAYGGQGQQAGQMGQNLGVQGGGAYGGMGAAAGQMGQNIGVQAGSAYGGMGAGYGSQAAGLAGQSINAGQAGMQAGMGYGQAAQNPNAVQNYMNPYLQSALQPALQEVQRQYDITGTQQMGNATKSGAFGGSREALMAAENQRNKNTAMNQIIGQGYNQAYNTANTNMQQAASLGMQGAGVGITGLNAANQNYQTGIQGAQTGLQGAQTALAGTAQGIQGAQTGLQGVNAQLAGTAQGMQGSQIGLQGANQAGQLSTAGGQLGVQGAQAAGNLGLAGTAQGMQGAQIAGQLGISGANAGLQGVQGAVGAGQYGLQGVGQANAAAGTLGQLGQTQFAQEQAANQAMLAAGTQQQQNAQKDLDVAYQQYQAQLNHPYQQIGFMSDLLRGMPLTQQSTSMYQNPSMVSQAAGLGTAGIGAYGMYKMANAEGGRIKENRMANGGVTQLFDVGGAIKSNLSRMSPEELQEYIAESSSPTAKRMAQQLLAEKTALAKQQNAGVTQLPSNLPVGEAMAGGGIIAFAEGDRVESSDSLSDSSRDTRTDADSILARLIAGASEENNIRPIPGSEMAQAGIANDAGTVAIPVAAPPPTTGAALPPPPQNAGIAPLVEQPPTRLPAAGAAPVPAAPATSEKSVYGNMPLISPEAKEAFSQYAGMYKDMRGDNKKAREEAKWMAIMQAGLGIAGGTSPNALANISQGAQPAIAQFQSAIKDIRKDDREAVKGLIDLGLTKEKFKQEVEKMGLDWHKAERVFDAHVLSANATIRAAEVRAAAEKQPKSITEGDITDKQIQNGILIDRLTEKAKTGPLTDSEKAALANAQSSNKYYMSILETKRPVQPNAVVANAVTTALGKDERLATLSVELSRAQRTGKPTKEIEAKIEKIEREITERVTGGSTPGRGIGGTDGTGSAPNAGGPVGLPSGGIRPPRAPAAPASSGIFNYDPSQRRLIPTGG